jgi:uncharacterized membrane protein YdbT with pleckstrin-like domain
MSSEINTGEIAIWEGKPSQWMNFKTYIYCILMAVAVIIVLCSPVKFKWLFALLLIYPAVRALFAWYELYSVSYKLTEARILHREGVFNRVTTETKLSEIKEVLLIEPWYKRIIGLGDIRLNITSFSESYITVSGIRNAEKIKELFNKTIERQHTEKS